MGWNWEAWLRRVMWGWREKPAEQLKKSGLILGAVLVIGGCLYFAVARRGKSVPMITDARSDVLLRDRLREAYHQAVKAGAVLPLTTASSVIVREAGIPFVLTTLDASRAAAKNGGGAPAAKPAPAGGKPFDAFERVLPAMKVVDLGSTHSLVLNKYPVVPHHSVVVTKAFEPQQRLLSTGDIGALWRCVSAIGGVGFFNCGAASGASQPRRHTQFIPYESLAKTYPGAASASDGHGAATGSLPRAASGSSSTSMLSTLDAASAGASTVLGTGSSVGAAAAAGGGGTGGNPLGRGIDIPVDAAVHSQRRHDDYAHTPGEPFTLAEFSSFPHAVCMLGGDVAVASYPAASQRIHAFYLNLLAAVYGPGVTAYAHGGSPAAAAAAGGAVPVDDDDDAGSTAGGSPAHAAAHAAARSSSGGGGSSLLRGGAGTGKPLARADSYAALFHRITSVSGDLDTAAPRGTGSASGSPVASAAGAAAGGPPAVGLELGGAPLAAPPATPSHPSGAAAGAGVTASGGSLGSASRGGHHRSMLSSWVSSASLSPVRGATGTSGGGGGGEGADPHAAPAHNMIITPRWMMVIPRTAAKWRSSVSVNSLGFAGLMLVEPVDLQAVTDAGPLEVLRAVVEGDAADV